MSTGGPDLEINKSKQTVRIKGIVREKQEEEDIYEAALSPNSNNIHGRT
jgi:hypothetical protein